MISKSRKLLGVVCFFVSFGIFGAIRLLSENRNKTTYYLCDTCTLDDLSSKLDLARLLLKLHKVIELGADKTLVLDQISKHYFTLEIPHVQSYKQLTAGFNVQRWLVAPHDTILNKLRAFRTYNNRQYLIDKCQQYLQGKDPVLALHYISYVYTTDPTCIAWRDALVKFVAVQRAIQQYAARLLMTH